MQSKKNTKKSFWFSSYLVSVLRWSSYWKFNRWTIDTFGLFMWKLRDSSRIRKICRIEQSSAWKLCHFGKFNFSYFWNRIFFF